MYSPRQNTHYCHISSMCVLSWQINKAQQDQVVCPCGCIYFISSQSLKNTHSVFLIKNTPTLSCCSVTAWLLQLSTLFIAGLHLQDNNKSIGLQTGRENRLTTIGHHYIRTKHTHTHFSSSNQLWIFLKFTRWGMNSILIVSWPAKDSTLP